MIVSSQPFKNITATQSITQRTVVKKADRSVWLVVGGVMDGWCRIPSFSGNHPGFSPANQLCNPGHRARESVAAYSPLLSYSAILQAFA